MNRAIVTIGVGSLHEKLLEIATPSYQAFARRHGWDLFKAKDIGQARPPAWYKVQAIINMLKIYDEVLFLGSDTLIVDGREDLIAPAEAWQALVAHHTGDGEVPNTDMWLCRKPMIPYLEQIWENKKWLMHGWWEQAALLEIMGYMPDVRPTYCRDLSNELYRHTHFLDNSWNVHKWDHPQPIHPRIQHATMYENRAAIMLGWAEEAKGWMNEH